MSTSVFNRFEKIGARLQIRPRNLGPGRFLARDDSPNYTIDVRADREGEYFDVAAMRDATVTLDVVDIAPKLRHLLLLVRDGRHKEKYLCGHDERHWFVAGVAPSATTVRRAMEMLQPEKVAEKAKAVGVSKRLKRKSKAFIRQGEWFFVPAPDLVIPQGLGHTIYPNEPLRRNMRSKAHVVEEVFRTGGQTVYVMNRIPLRPGQIGAEERTMFENGFTEAQRRAYFKRRPEAAGWPWMTMQRNPDVYARGRVRHPDHRTIYLDGWHRVYLNNEERAERFKFSVAFLD